MLMIYLSVKVDYSSSRYEATALQTMACLFLHLNEKNRKKVHLLMLLSNTYTAHIFKFVMSLQENEPYLKEVLSCF